MKRKTRIERVYNEDTGWFETREVELNSYSFTDDDRIMIVREYMESGLPRSEEHTSELQSLFAISYAVFCLKKLK